MNIADYARAGARTLDPATTQPERLANAALGLAGESGEIAEIIANAIDADVSIRRAEGCAKHKIGVARRPAFLNRRRSGASSDAGLSFGVAPFAARPNCPRSAYPTRRQFPFYPRSAVSDTR